MALRILPDSSLDFIERTYALAEVGEAHRFIEGRNTRGELLIDLAAR